MKKTELVSQVASATKLTKKDVNAVINATLDSIQDALIADDSVQFVGFGKFETRMHQKRTGRDLRTQKSITIPAHKVVVFKVGSHLKNAVK